jgi:hypothetical protein
MVSRIILILPQIVRAFIDMFAVVTLCSSQDERHLVSAAWKCAHQTYHPEEEISSTAYCTFQTNKVVKPSDARGVKAMTATTVAPTTGGREEDGLLPALIIAVRGSASKMDHIVNANHSPRSASTFLVR